MTRKYKVTELAKWAHEHKKIVVATSSIAFVFCATSLLSSFSNTLTKDIDMKKTKVFLDQENNSKKINGQKTITSLTLTPGFYFVNEEDIVLDENGIPSAILVKKDMNKKESNIFLSIGDQILENIYLQEDFHKMLNEYILESSSEKKKQEIEETKIEEEEYIRTYSEIYGLDYDKVYHILSSVTDHFKDKDYVSEYKIGNSMLKKRSVVCDNKEMALLIAVRNLYYEKDRYGNFYDNLQINKEYTTQLDYAHQIKEVSEILGIDPVLNYAICKSMTDNFANEIFLENHNPGGLVFDGSYASFPNNTAGFIEQSQCHQFKKLHKKMCSFYYGN